MMSENFKDFIVYQSNAEGKTFTMVIDVGQKRQTPLWKAIKVAWVGDNENKRAVALMSEILRLKGKLLKVVMDKRPLYQGEQRKITVKYYVIGNEITEVNADHVKVGDKFYDKIKIGETEILVNKDEVRVNE
jgi:hypothetical protein